ncbi:MAG: flagellar basal body L-ring protein FlgH [Campylobacterota bacterium]|nr:flagellar basal body L-ring protein FlgH [Campylobacterota bacterium]
MKNILIILLSSFVIIFSTGCTANLADPEISFEPPKYVEQMPSREDEKDFSSVGSIFGQGDNPLFSDHKAMHVNDIVTVVISENAQSSSSSQKKLSEADDSTLGGGVFSGGGMLGLAGKLNPYTDLGFESKSVSNFAGQGVATKDAKFTTTITARIVKVMENGNYFISGKRELLIDKQKQIVQISGVIRPYDIDQDNQVDSAKMSDARIFYNTQGDVDRATDQGWGTKMVEAVWPF